MGLKGGHPNVTFCNDIFLPHTLKKIFFPLSLFPPIEFFGNSTTCSTPNKFSTWTMGDLLQGMETIIFISYPPLLTSAEDTFFGHLFNVFHPRKDHLMPLLFLTSHSSGYVQNHPLWLTLRSSFLSCPPKRCWFIRGGNCIYHSFD